MRKVAIFGTGYVGLVTGICLASFGNEVFCIDKDKKKIEGLKKGKLFLYEPGLKEVYEETKERIEFTTDSKRPLEESGFIYICVGTPEDKDGNADLKAVKEVAKEIGKNIGKHKVIIIKSTVPVGTNKTVDEIIEKESKGKADFSVVSNPEFLREGQAVEDFFNPKRIILGSGDKRGIQRVKELYAPFKANILETDPHTAELIKYASNAFLATKISFINAISQLCYLTGADVDKVAEGMGLDERIGKEFLKTGPGFGGSCFPKDSKALLNTAKSLGFDFKILDSVLRTNDEQKKFIVRLLEDIAGDLKGKKIAVLGLAFKAETDDIRESPSIDIVGMLLSKGAAVSATDPQAIENFKSLYPSVRYFDDPYEAAKDADALVILTEWELYKKLDYKKIKDLMKKNFVLDARNILTKKEMEKLGFKYQGVGR